MAEWLSHPPVETLVVTGSDLGLAHNLFLHFFLTKMNTVQYVYQKFRKKIPNRNYSQLKNPIYYPLHNFKKAYIKSYTNISEKTGDHTVWAKVWPETDFCYTTPEKF